MNTVQPIRSKRKLTSIKKMLKGASSPRNYLLFVLGLNMALRIGDLLDLRVRDVTEPDGTLREYVNLRESKTGKEKRIKLNPAVKEALEHYFESVSMDNRDRYLFKSFRSDKPIDRFRAYSLINQWTQDVGLNHGPYGCHTLRKTWGYMARTEYGIPIEKIQAKLGHSNPAVTKRYIGITDDEIEDVENGVVL